MSQLVYDKFILFGDSITQFSTSQQNGFGMHPALQDLYARKLDILNRGYGGYNSDHAVLILPEILKAELNDAKDNVKLMTIFFGTNDAFEIEDDINDIQAVPLERYKKNISKLTELCLENNIKPIIIGPSLHDNRIAKIGYEERGRPTDKDATSNKRYLSYSLAAEEVAKENNVAFVNMWEAFREFGGWTIEQLVASNGSSDDETFIPLGDLLIDGVHFTPEAYRILFKKVVESINKTYPEFDATNIPEKLSYWQNINPKDQKNSIFKSIQRGQ
ncbi:SGNH hydrolase-type esterase domain-containing protein [Scheffersomyces xylosifermentans]|uniref:SGNH hydrolase-type esterase domain-containing protein n=1 Tax=Scheffersomyces xylosifermentans TaxID=1304137 RepID=UPI00315D4143